MLSPSDQQRLVSSFLEIAVGQTSETARQFLEATSWKLEEAVQLFYVGGEGGILPSGTTLSQRWTIQWLHSLGGMAADTGNERMQNDVVDDEVRAPLPVVRETLYGDSMYYGATRVGNSQREPASLIAFRNFSEEPKSPGIWEPDEVGASSASASGSASAPEAAASAPRDSLASLYRPLFHLMLHGSFEQAKATSSSQDKWLLVNLQSTTEFSSHMLNRDTWANEAVSQTIKANFIFWQVYDDTTEGKKVCTYYKLESIPVVLVIDPTTGQKMRMWSGMVEPENLLRGFSALHGRWSSNDQEAASHWLLIPNPKVVTKDDDEEAELQRALAASLEDNDMKESSDDNKSAITPEEVVAVEAVTQQRCCQHSHLCRKNQREATAAFSAESGYVYQTDRESRGTSLKPTQFSCSGRSGYSQLEESERKKPLKLTQAIQVNQRR
ncbi:Plant UBX domain-containing protein 7 [Raphanus sativus]|nr:Plant UBX domain-containing protein 7 [Raphanus sativus]